MAVQLGANELEDKCKMGNMAELKAFLNGLPIRLTCDWLVIRKAQVSL